MANKATAPTSRGGAGSHFRRLLMRRTELLCFVTIAIANTSSPRFTRCIPESSSRKQILIINDNENSRDSSQIRVMSNLTQRWMIG